MMGCTASTFSNTKEQCLNIVHLLDARDNMKLELGELKLTKTFESHPANKEYQNIMTVESQNGTSLNLQPQDSNGKQGSNCMGEKDEVDNLSVSTFVNREK